MRLTREEVRKCVIESLTEVSSGANGSLIDDHTDPMSKLGLDSHDGVNFACKLTQKLNYDIPNDINPLVNDECHRPRTVGQIVNLICALVLREEGLDNG